MTFKLIGGHPAVDFVNTVGGFAPALEELLPGYPDLVAWTEQAGLLTHEHAGLLRAVAETEPGAAAAVLAAARRLRADLDAVVRAELAGHAPEEAHLVAIHDAYVAALARARLTRESVYGWSWPASSAEPDSVLWPIAAQIVGLLGSADLTRLAECSTANCRWIYLDRTKNHNRRWCSDDTCGASARMRRYRAARRHRDPSRTSAAE
ncbi:zf-CGNR multi-domain protein [Jiangella ureilytica]|uniref:Zf-CGNR multi-domain protein n=1 Tax=Jiangella ureilytica TaxID=2530374 RepID=A0A4R4RIZ4_9ACTN|nr:CGNR zinc finger domain-containing protein [Jiangella ureilytica]TDC49541.1 zf-CGNR multi-domain protein [Jiangella ureilytica]